MRAITADGVIINATTFQPMLLIVLRYEVKLPDEEDTVIEFPVEFLHDIQHMFDKDEEFYYDQLCASVEKALEHEYLTDEERLGIMRYMCRKQAQVMAKQEMPVEDGYNIVYSEDKIVKEDEKSKHLVRRLLHKSRKFVKLFTTQLRRFYEKSFRWFQ